MKCRHLVGRRSWFRSVREQRGQAKSGRTCDSTVNHCPIFELDCDSLVVELHLRGGRGLAPVLAGKGGTRELTRNLLVVRFIKRVSCQQSRSHPPVPPWSRLQPNTKQLLFPSVVEVPSSPRIARESRPSRLSCIVFRVRLSSTLFAPRLSQSDSLPVCCHTNQSIPCVDLSPREESRERKERKGRGRGC